MVNIKNKNRLILILSVLILFSTVSQIWADNFLFILFDAGETNGLIPVIQRIKAKKLGNVSIISLATSSKILKRKKINFDVLKNFICNDKINFSIKYDKIKYDHHIGNYIPMRYISSPELVTEIIKREKPNAIITGLVSNLEFNFLMEGNNLKIPTFGFFDFYDIPDKNSIFWKGLNLADYNFVTSQKIKSGLLKIDSKLIDKIIVTGHPNFSKLAILKKKFNRKKILKRAKLEDKKYFIFTTQYSDDNDKLLNLLIEVLKNKYKKYDLIIAIHPRQDPVHYKKIISNSKIAKRIHLLNRKLISVYEAMLISDIVFTETSTTGFEAILLDKDLIHIFNKKYNPLTEYSVRNNLSLFCNDKKSLINSINRFINNIDVSKLRKNVKNTYPLPDSTKNILDFIKNKIRQD